MGHVAGAPSTHASALIGSKSANACSVPPQPSRPRAGYVEQSHFLSQIPNYHPNADRPSPVVQTPGAGAPEHRIRRDRRRGRRRMGKQGRRRRPRGIRAGFSRYVSFYFRRIGNQLTDVVFSTKGFNDKRTGTPNTPGRQIPAKASSSTAGLRVFDPGSVAKELNPESGVKPFKSNSAGRTKPKHGKFILTLV